MFQIKTFPSHVFLTNRLGHEFKRSIFFNANQTILHCFSKPKGGWTPINMNHCPINPRYLLGFPEQNMHCLSGTALKVKLYQNKFQFSISMPVSCWKSRSKNSSPVKSRDISRKPQFPESNADKTLAHSLQPFPLQLLYGNGIGHAQRWTPAAKTKLN